MIPQMVAAEAASKAASNKATPYIIGGVILLVGGLSIYVTVKYLEFFQVKDTREEKKETKKAGRLTNEESFDPVHARNQPSRVTISQQKAEALAALLYDANGHNRGYGFGTGYLIDDKEEQAKGAIRQAGSSYNVSKIADVFFKKYNKGLVDDLMEWNGDSGLSEYYEIVDNFKS